MNLGLEIPAGGLSTRDLGNAVCFLLAEHEEFLGFLEHGILESLDVVFLVF